MGTRYNHFTLEERCRLAAMIEMGLPVTEIALRLGRHRGTIHRELERNRNVDGYRPDSADRRAWARKLRGSRIERSTRLGNHVRDCLAMGWSPEQIAGLMELDGVEHSISTESIPPRLQPDRSAGRLAEIPASAQIQTRTASPERQARTGHPKPRPYRATPCHR